ncbi:MAG TPA: DUF2911 domain-containing protein [Longimicrobiales bacterium]
MRLKGAVLLFATVVGAMPALAQGGEKVDVACKPQRPWEQVKKRVSPYDSTAFRLAGQRVLVCYGRPSLRGRHMVGGEAVPFGKLWRTGANEPTIVHLPVAATIAGIHVQPGSYSLYTVPAEKEWTVVVNRSTSQWGEEHGYTPEIEKQEVGRAKVAAERLKAPVEQFTIRALDKGARRADLVLEWEHSRVVVPVQAAGK